MRTIMTPEPKSLPRELLKGAIAGLVATFVMTQVNALLYQQEPASAKRKEKRARRGRTTYGPAVSKVAAMVGTRLSRERRERLEVAIHWGLGVGTGALYAALRDRFDRLDTGYGLALGTAFWGVVDEGLNPVLGLSPAPAELPWQAHGRELAGHLSYGLVTENALRLLDRVM